ncbi:superoxide dismutase, Ni [Candidatus Woesearchaeota archaeon]|nr:superoxide dismutase, Ni [Candidatus Woesearchaeota archaeon]
MNSLLYSILRKFELIAKPTAVYAHCDVPCGIYETDTVRHGVETVKSMTDKLAALQGKSDISTLNAIARMAATKEEWAQRVKNELLILWTDYFRPEHLQKWPNLHERVWKAAKLCSDVKRTVDSQKVAELSAAVDEIAGIFAETKK